jgi:hypothetical protein
VNCTCAKFLISSTLDSAEFWRIVSLGFSQLAALVIYQYFVIVIVSFCTQGDAFAYDSMVAGMRVRATEAGFTLPKNFSLVDVNFMELINPKEVCPAAAHWWCGTGVESVIVCVV